MKRKVTVFADSKKLVVEYAGVFHGFSQDHMEYESGPGNFPVAIIERDDGSVESVYVGIIKFDSEEEI